MEGEGAVALEHGLIRASPGEDGPGVAEPTANRVRTVEGLHRPAVRTDAASSHLVRPCRRVVHKRHRNARSNSTATEWGASRAPVSSPVPASAPHQTLW